MSGTQFMLDYRTEMTVYFQETIGAKHMFKSEAKEFFFFFLLNCSQMVLVVKSLFDGAEDEMSTPLSFFNKTILDGLVKLKLEKERHKLKVNDQI